MCSILFMTQVAPTFLCRLHRVKSVLTLTFMFSEVAFCL